MTQLRIEALLRQKIGLDPDSIGTNAIARAMARHMAKSGVSDLETYLTRLQTSPIEWQELIELIIVPETWFFRDREPFNFLSHYVISQWLPQHPGEVLRVLSIPCSTGEEPYSIAISLMESGLSSKNFQIDAVDISQSNLFKARKAIYAKNSFRGHGLEFRDRYFCATTSGYQLSDLVVQTVNFIHSNILDPWLLVNRLPYDIIFCRNLLIYLTKDARKKVIQVLDQLLTAKGLLFVGHSETGQILNPKFVAIRHALAFAHQKSSQVPKNIQSNQSQHKLNQNITNKKSNISLDTNKIKSPKPPVPKPPIVQNYQISVQEELLSKARDFADQGNLTQAESLCQTYLQNHQSSAEAYLLLGEINQANQNNDKAEKCFNKVIYLEPNHEQALMYLALLKEQQGDLDSATVLRQRLQRLRKI